MFFVGSSSLGAEIAVARLMAPFFGDSTIIWANTIAVVLVALAVGYWFGGRMADRHPHLRGLCLLVLAASLLLGLVPIVAHPFLTLSVRNGCATSGTRPSSTAATSTSVHSARRCGRRSAMRPPNQ